MIKHLFTFLKRVDVKKQNLLVHPLKHCRAISRTKNVNEATLSSSQVPEPSQNLNVLRLITHTHNLFLVHLPTYMIHSEHSGYFLRVNVGNFYQFHGFFGLNKPGDGHRTQLVLCQQLVSLLCVLDKQQLHLVIIFNIEKGWNTSVINKFQQY